MSLFMRHEDCVEKVYFSLRFLFKNLVNPKTRLKNYKAILLEQKSLFILKNFVHRFKKIYSLSNENNLNTMLRLRIKSCGQKDYKANKEIDLFPRNINFLLRLFGKTNVNSFKNLKRVENPFSHNILNVKNLFYKRSVVDFLTFLGGKLKKTTVKITTDLIFFFFKIFRI